MSHPLRPKMVTGAARALVRLLFSVTVIAGITAGNVAVAQDSGTPPASSGTSATSGNLEEVVVTGSRVGRSTFTTPNPVTVLDSQDIQNLGLVNVSSVLAELPQNSNFFAANNVGLGNFNV
ncbi:MAG TPA: hypothetical protein VMC02_08055, partial [Steroidobacteraceae bacterium]|nr:hypothetical protein [Steroidobacteraceae bacterium]